MLNQSTYRKAKKLIPGGTQLLSKRPEMFAPDSWPSYFSKSKGVMVWDLEGNKFIDMSIMAVGAVIIGYSDDEINARVVEAIENGVQTSLNCPAEVTLAETLIELHPWFDMVRYCKSGGEAMSIAVRIARAATGRDKVFFNGYHGWHDWYLAANLTDQKALDGRLMPGLMPSGVPRNLFRSSFPLDIENFRHSIDASGESTNDIAAFVIEPARGLSVSDEILLDLKAFCDENGIVLIFDEITSGFRVCTGGMHRTLPVKPHMAVLAKAIANGFPMAVVMGVSAVMSAAQDTFISSTNWTESTGLFAAIGTIKKYEENNVHKHISRVGAKMKAIWSEAFIKHSVNADVYGIDSLPAFSIKEGNESLFNSFFVHEFLLKGFLSFRQFKPALAHKDEHLDLYEQCLYKILEKYDALDRDLSSYLPAHSGFYRLTK